MQGEFPNLCVNSSQLNPTLQDRQIWGSTLGCLKVICVKSPFIIRKTVYVDGMQVCIQT